MIIKRRVLIVEQRPAQREAWKTALLLNEWVSFEIIEAGSVQEAVNVFKANHPAPGIDVIVIADTGNRNDPVGLYLIQWFQATKSFMGPVIGAHHDPETQALQAIAGCAVAQENELLSVVLKTLCVPTT